MKDVRFRVVLGMILAAAAVRLLPHAPNFTPIGAMALFGAARFRDLRMAFLAPLATLALSQIPLGFLPWFPVVALAFVLEGFLGLLLRNLPHCRNSLRRLAGLLFGDEFRRVGQKRGLRAHPGRAGNVLCRRNSILLEHAGRRRVLQRCALRRICAGGTKICGVA
jgi:hypothetical protein